MLCQSARIYRKKKNQYFPLPLPLCKVGALSQFSYPVELVQYWPPLSRPLGLQSPDPLLTRITNNQLNGLRLRRTGITFEIILTKQESQSLSGQIGQSPQSPYSPSPRGRESPASFLNQSLVSDISPDLIGWNNRAGVFISQQYWSHPHLPHPPPL